MDLDDLDDLLEDMPDNKVTKKADPAPAGRPRVMTFGRNDQKKKVDDDDGWGDMDDDPVPYKAKPSTAAVNNRTSFGSGKADGLRKEPKKPEDDDDEWGLDLDSKPTKGSGFGGLLGRKPKKDDSDDDLDGFLDNLEAKRGIESTKPPEPPKQQRAKTANTRSPWGAANELDDLDDAPPAETASQISQRGDQQSVAEKRKALFGLGSATTNQNKPANQRPNRAQTAAPSREFNQNTKSQQNIGLGFTTQSAEPSENYMNHAEGNASMGSHGSQIETLEVPGSRQRRMLRPPTAATNQSGGPPRPPTGGQNQGLNQIQQLHKNNILTRPDTANRPSGGIRGTLNNTEDEGAFDLLNESHHTGSNLGSHISGTNRLQPPQPAINKNFQQTTTTHADFERDHEDLEDASSYEEYDSPVEEEGGKATGSDSDEDGGSLYMPTIVAKSKPAATKTKKKKKKKKKAKQTENVVPVMSDFMNSPEQQKNFTSNSGGAIKGMEQQNFGGIPTYPHSGTAAGATGGAMQPSQGSTTLAAGQTYISPQSPPKRKIRPKEPKAALEFDIEEEHEKINKMEAKYRAELEEQRKNHQKEIDETERKHQAKRQQHEDEKKQLIIDKNNALEESKKKITQLNRIDIENRELQYQKNLENQRQLFEDQQHNLKKQLQERVQINELAQQINSSTGNISSLVAKIGAANQGELQRREDDIIKREKEVDEKRRQIADRKQAIEQRRRKLQQEIEEIKSRETETKMDYQREKAEIATDLDQIEMQHLQEVRQVRDKAIEQEVETRKVRAECERLTSQIERDEHTHQSKQDQWQVEKKQIQQAHENFTAESISQEKELRLKLEAVHDTFREVLREETTFDKKKQEFDDEHNKVIVTNDELQEELDQYCIEKQDFERMSSLVNEKAEQDRIDSEKIGYFKANKDQLKEDLRIQKNEIEAERQQLREDRIKLGIFKNDLATKQKTIESLRYNYIKAEKPSIPQAATKLASAAVPKPPAEQVVPNEEVTPLVRREMQSAAPRFNYEEYMKNLNDRLANSAPNSNAAIGADFQAYMMRERACYTKSIAEAQQDTPLIHSLAAMREARAKNLYSPDARSKAFQAGASATSLHQMSVGLSSNGDL